MANKNNILILCGVLILLGIVLVSYGISYNNSTMVQLNNGVMDAFGGEKDNFGSFCIGGGLCSGIAAIVLYFRSNR